MRAFTLVFGSRLEVSGSKFLARGTKFLARGRPSFWLALCEVSGSWFPASFWLAPSSFQLAPSSFQLGKSFKFLARAPSFQLKFLARSFPEADIPEAGDDEDEEEEAEL